MDFLSKIILKYDIHPKSAQLVAVESNALIFTRQTYLCDQHPDQEIEHC